MSIDSERLVIRIAQPADAEAIYSYRSDPDKNRYQGWIPRSVAEVRDYIYAMPESLDTADVCFEFAVILKSEGELIGDIAVSFSGHDMMQAEVGCTLNKDFQREGYATEAMTAMVDYLFGTLSKHRVIASVDPRNSASVRLMERLGFRKEAHFRESYYLRGEWVDDIIYAILKKEWAV